ncbi:hypothetical protein ACQKO6_17695 [Pseudomonas monteilii]
MRGAEPSGHLQQIEAVVDAKLLELAKIPVGALTGRRLELAGSVDAQDYYRRSMLDMGQRLGRDFLETTPVVVLEQLCVVSAVRGHDTAGLIKSLVNSFMVAYITPETTGQAFVHLEGLEALRQDVSQARGQLRRNSRVTA